MSMESADELLVLTSSPMELGLPERLELRDEGLLSRALSGDAESLLHLVCFR